jgi:CubicO group peptidase (beta-lactamase class C family)
MGMKKLLAVLLSIVLLTAVGCAAAAPMETTIPATSLPVETTVPVVTQPPVTEPEIVTDELRAKFDAVAAEYKFEGILYLTHQGKEVYRFVSGTDDLGEPLTLESSLYMSSVSKQFCAAAIVMLRDQGKLSLEDTLEKYFPEYTIGKDITIC